MRTARMGSPLWASGLVLPRDVAREEVGRILARAGGYRGADLGRRQLSEWVTPSMDADESLLFDLPKLRDRSSDLARNNPIAAGAFQTKLTGVIGTGLNLVAAVDTDRIGISDDEADEFEELAEAEWDAFANSPNCDLERCCDLHELAALAYLGAMERGDVAVSLPFLERSGSPLGLKVQLIEADRISNPNDQMDTESIAGGVERNARGEVIRYWISDFHPGSGARETGSRTWTPVQAFQDNGRPNLLLMMRRRRIGQSRGVPDLAPVIEPLKMLDRYSEAELMAAVIGSMFTVFVKTAGSEQTFAPMEPIAETGAKRSDKDIKLAAGAIVGLNPGEEIDLADPKRPNDKFDPFVSAIIKWIGVGLNLPMEVLTKAYLSSYSASRAAMLEAWRYFLMERRWVVKRFYQPIYEAMLMESIARGRLRAPGFLQDELLRRAYSGAEWIGPAKGQIDEKKELEAAGIREDRFYSTKGEEAAAMTGGSLKRKLRRIAKERRMIERAGLKVESTPAPAPPAPPPPPEDDDEVEDDLTFPIAARADL